MNRENLQRMADYIRTVPQYLFEMDKYRDVSDDCHSPKCNSVGCVIGHCTFLDEYLFNSLSPYNIFVEWSERFTSINSCSYEWKWCFNWKWVNIDNTPTGAADRIEWLLENGLPENWRNQMYGNVPREQLCYKK